MQIEACYENIIELLSSILKVSKDDLAEFKIDGDLGLIGLDSKKVIQLIVKLEEDYNITFDEKDLLYRNVNTIDRITKTLLKYLD